MGSRAQYVVVEHGAWTLHFSHWGASCLADDLAFGPQAATRCFRAARATDDADRVRADAWLDDVWCEGAALVDHDRRILLWFSDAVCDWDEWTAAQAVLARTWPGWDVRWAHDGLGDLHVHLGLGRDFVREPRPFAWGKPFLPDARNDEYVGTLVTGRSPVGELNAWASSLSAVEQLPHLRGLLLDFGTPPPVLTCMPLGGIHLDLETHTMGLWTVGTAVGLPEGVLPGPNRWRLEFWGADHTRQLERAGGCVRFPATDLTPALTSWRTRIGVPPPDPARLLARAAADSVGDGVTVSVSPSATVPHDAAEPTATERALLDTAISAVLDAS
jgi:hypothetical protein